MAAGRNQLFAARPGAKLWKGSFPFAIYLSGARFKRALMLPGSSVGRASGC